LKLAECQSVVDEVGDPPLKFLKAAKQVKLVPNTTHRLGQGGILGQSSICKYPPSPPFLSCKDSNKVIVEFLSSQIGQFAIPLRCVLHRKDRSNGVLAF
jgi:hypothetical protein